MNVTNDLIKLKEIFNEHGEQLYLVGGVVRDYLLKRFNEDYDLATTATPQKMISFLSCFPLDYHQKDLGSIKINFHNLNYEITTLRKESGVIDYRYPKEIVFVKDIEDDYLRRDFTINALYYDFNKIIDFCFGLRDLQEKKIRFIGIAEQRIKEDPVRILRGIRFSLTLSFDIIDLDLYFSLAYLIKPLGIIKYQELLRIFELENKKIKDYLLILEKAYPDLDFKLIFNEGDYVINYLNYLYQNEINIFNNLIMGKDLRKRIKNSAKVEI